MIYYLYYVSTNINVHTHVLTHNIQLTFYTLLDIYISLRSISMNVMTLACHT